MAANRMNGSTVIARLNHTSSPNKEALICRAVVELQNGQATLCKEKGVSKKNSIGFTTLMLHTLQNTYLSGQGAV